MLTWEVLLEEDHRCSSKAYPWLQRHWHRNVSTWGTLLLLTCGCGPVLCMACMSPAVDSELCSKKAWYFYDGSKLEHHSSTLMKLQSRAMTVFSFFVTLLAIWSCDHPPVISSAAIQYFEMDPEPWTQPLQCHHKKGHYSYFLIIFLWFYSQFPHVMSIFLVIVKGSHSLFGIYLRKEDS